MFRDVSAVMGLLGNRDKVAAEVRQFQQRAAQLTADATSPDGRVTATANGRLEVVRVQVHGAGTDGLGDAVAAAVNRALADVRQQLAAERAKMAANLGLSADLLGGLSALGLG